MRRFSTLAFVSGLMMSGYAFAHSAIYFEANEGQSGPDVKYVFRGGRISLELASSRAIFTFQNGRKLNMRWPESSPQVSVEPLQRLAGVSNYLIGSDPTRWLTDVPQYGSVQFHSLWPGVDLLFYGRGSTVEYDFVLRPGARPDALQVLFEGADAVQLDNSGNLVLRVGDFRIRQHRPTVYQITNGARIVINAEYILRGERLVGLHVGPYDHTKILTIDPLLSYSTQLGGSSEDIANAVAVDGAGNAYMTGNTLSLNFPTAHALQRNNGGSGMLPWDVFVTKLSADGSTEIYSTYIGGSGFDYGRGIAVDAAGDAFIAGNTTSGDFPTTPGVFQRTKRSPAGSQAFVAKLSPDGSKLVYCTYIGSTGDDEAHAIAVDATGQAFITGQTISSAKDFPTTAGAAQTRAPGLFIDAFLTKLNPAGTGLLYSTLLGGSSNDYGNGVAIDSNGNAYVTGKTSSKDFPVTIGVAQSTYMGGQFTADGDGFVAKVNALGSNILYATFLGGTADDTGNAIAIDSKGNAYVAGTTASTDFPVTQGSLQTKLVGGPGGDAFVTKLNPTGTMFTYSTYLGSSGGDQGLGIAVDSGGNAYVSGQTQAADFPSTMNAFQPRFGNPLNRGFLLKLNAQGNDLLYSTFIGRSGSNFAHAVAITALGDAVVVGETRSLDFQTTAGVIQPAFGGISDAFAMLFDFSKGPKFTAAGLVNAASFAGGAVSPGEIITIFGSEMGPANLAGLQIDPNGRVATTISGTRVLFDGIPAPLIYSASGQVSAIIPYEVAGKTSTHFYIEYNGVPSEMASVPIRSSAPAIFTQSASGTGPGAVLNQDNTLNTGSNPADRGSTIVVFATGEGQTSPSGVNGSIANTGLPKPLLPVSAKIGGIDADVIYAGAAPTLVAGVLQVNVRVSEAVSPGPTVPIIIDVGGVSTQTGVTVAIR